MGEQIQIVLMNCLVKINPQHSPCLAVINQERQKYGAKHRRSRKRCTEGRTLQAEKCSQGFLSINVGTFITFSLLFGHATADVAGSETRWSLLASQTLRSGLSVVGVQYSLCVCVCVCVCVCMYMYICICVIYV